MNFVHSITAILKRITVIRYHRNQDLVTVIERGTRHCHRPEQERR
jgi:hypothetical protein